MKKMLALFAAAVMFTACTKKTEEVNVEAPPADAPAMDAPAADAPPADGATSSEAPAK